MIIVQAQYKLLLFKKSCLLPVTGTLTSTSHTDTFGLTGCNLTYQLLTKKSLTIDTRDVIDLRPARLRTQADNHKEQICYYN